METYQLKISYSWKSTIQNPVYTCTLKEWYFGIPFGEGKTIQDAIEDFLDYWQMKFGEEINNYKWS